MSNNTGSDLYGTNFSAESMKVIAESIGINNLTDDAAKELAEDISFKLKHIIQDAAKFANHSKRTKLTASDIDGALRSKNLEPQYGFQSKEPLPYRFASGGGRELHFIEEKEVDLGDLMQSVNLNTPLDPSLRSHWLFIDGIQPTVPENPPPVSTEIQKLDSVDPINKKPNKETAGKPVSEKQKLKNVETVQIKQLATHELSAEQQLYYKEITEACVGSDPTKRTEALWSLCTDPGLHEMLPRMCTFIIEGVRVNVVQGNLAILSYLMRMVKALLDNPSLYLERYLHELIPAVITCVVSKSLCQRHDVDKHWVLRDFAAKLIAQICKNFNTDTNNIQTRITRIYSNALQQYENVPITSLYGAISGISELGPEVVRVFLLLNIKLIGARIEPYLDGTVTPNTDRVFYYNIKQVIMRTVVPVLKDIRNPPDHVEEYKQEFGYLGPALHAAVVKARTQPTPPPTTCNFPPDINNFTVPVTRTVTQPRQIIQQNPAPQRTILMNQTSRVINQGQKVVLLTQRPQTPGLHVQTQPQSQPQNSVVKFVSNTNTITNSNVHWKPY